MSRWIKVGKRLPDTDRHVFALSGHGTFLAYVQEGDWYISKNIKLGDVTRWMEVPGEPKDLAYWWNRLKEWWGKRVQNVEDASEFLTGWTSRNAQLSKKIIYFENQRTGEIRMGLPEQFPASRGFQKVVCGSAHEAEVWSERLRRYNMVKEAKVDEERGRIEGEMAAEHRSKINHLIANSRSKYGKEFLRAHLERMERAESQRKTTREEYLHSEAYEKGH
jgi:hypothetical protein